LKEAQRSRVSYREIGASRDGDPPGYNVDHHRIQLGIGDTVFNRAVEALRAWKMFQLGWVELFWPSAPIAEGTTVAILAHLFGLWSLNAARIVYVVDEAEPVHRFGFAYGTLVEHVERGEERFTVERHREDDSVWYDVRAFSRPRHLLAIAAYPLGRRMQARFARDSLKAMLRHISAVG
jgi:uncharacterized protein (UPF0548 family)